MKTRGDLKLGYTTIFVEDVTATVEFYEKAFDLGRVMVTPKFAQMQSGGVSIGFVSRESLGRQLPLRCRENSAQGEPAGFQISFLTDDVEAAFHRAVSAGAVPVVKPHIIPWGQIVALVRDCNGVLVSIETPFHPLSA